MQQRMLKIEKSTIASPLTVNPQEPINESGPAARDCSAKKAYFCVTVVDLWGCDGVRRGKVGKQHESKKVAKVQHGSRIQGVRGGTDPKMSRPF